MANNKNENIKIILLGESGVGKTNLINVFFGLGFKEFIPSNISTNCFDGTFNYNNQDYNYSIWDTAGQELYKSINKMFIRDAKIILIVYSIIDRESFEEVKFWMDFLKENQGEKEYIIALIANKCDLYEKQIVSDDEGEKLSYELGIDFLTTSALSRGQSFKDFVNKLITRYIETILKKEDKEKNIKINNFNEPNKDKKIKVKKKFC